MLNFLTVPELLDKGNKSVVVHVSIIFKDKLRNSEMVENSCCEGYLLKSHSCSWFCRWERKNRVKV